MKKASRLVVFLLMLAIVSAFVTSCKTTPGSESSAAGESVNVKSELFGNLPNENYGDAEIKFLVEGDYRAPYCSEEIMPLETSATVLSKAVSDRNALVEDRFKVKISEVRTTTGDQMTSTIRNIVAAGTDEYDIVMPYIPDAAALSLENNFYLLNDFENIHLEEDYWDQAAVEGLSINNKNYFATGDFSVLTLACTHAVVFNKDIVTENSLENPYNLVKKGQWTIDKMKEMARKITRDSDGITGMTAEDTYGFLVNSNFATSMFVGSGERLTNKDADDLPLISVNSSKGVDVFTKIFDLFNDSQASGHIENLRQVNGTGKTVWQLATDCVANKRALFRAMAIVDIQELGNYECNFGILPIPKYDVSQDDYYSLVSTIYATCAAIPSSNQNPEMAAVILDAITQASTGTVKYSYYQTMLKDRKIQDNESEEMLDIIFSNHVFDLGNVFGWGDTSVYGNNSIANFMNIIAFSGSNTFASTFESISNKIQSDLDATIEKFNEKN
ncbi:MAG: hypothetical protein PHD66_01335 [Eubacteriales bacterium]|nr:hypothetical protein [Eubacteriales bacterium]